MCCRALPNDFIAEVIFAENFVHEHLYIVSNVIIQMYINRRCLAHNALDGHEVLIYPVEVLLLVPHIAVHLLLKGFQLVDVQLLLRLGDGLGHLGIPADVDLLGIVGAAGKGRVNVDQVHLDAPVLQIGTGGDALPSDHQVSVRVLAHRLLLLHLVQGHPPLEHHGHIVRTLVLEDAVEVAQYGLSLNGFGDEGDVFNRHGNPPYASMGT